MLRKKLNTKGILKSDTKTVKRKLATPHAKFALPETHKHVFHWRTNVTPAELEELANELLDYAALDTSLKLTPFITDKGYAWSTFYTYAQQSFPLANAIERALTIIGDRRESQALKYQIHPGIVLKTLPSYDPLYKKQLEWEAKLTQNTNDLAPSEKLVVNINTYPDSGIKHSSRANVVEENDGDKPKQVCAEKLPASDM